MKLRNFYRVDKNGKLMQGSNIRVPRNPDHTYWREFAGQKQICCDPDNAPDPVDCNCVSDRYFVRLDENKNPVPGTLMISRTGHKPKAFDWQEIRIAPCCEGVDDSGDNNSNPHNGGVVGNPGNNGSGGKD